jgi:hypothetical protein
MVSSFSYGNVILLFVYAMNEYRMVMMMMMVRVMMLMVIMAISFTL